MRLDDQLVTELKRQEQVIQVISLDILLEAYTRNQDRIKTGSGYVAPLMDTKTVKNLIEEFGFKAEKVVIKQYADGKKYVVFRGYAGNREVFTGTRYLIDNPKVVRMAIGPKGITTSVKGGTVVTAILFVGIEVFDYLIRDTATLSDLLGTVTGDLVKLGISSIAAAVAGCAVGSAAIVGSIAAGPLIAAVAVGIITGLVLEEIDKHIGATNALIKAYARMGISLREIKSDINRNLNFLERNPQYIPCLFGPCSVRGY